MIDGKGLNHGSITEIIRGNYNLMKILILGGTGFLGRDFTSLLPRNYDITLVNRGITNPNLFTDVKTIIIDRKKITDAYVKSTFLADVYDVVIDFSCYELSTLRPFINNINFKRYIFISTQAALTTSEALRPLKLSNLGMYQYITRKKECETYIRETFKNNVIVLQPGAIVGKHDNTNRFAQGRDGKFYWTCDQGTWGKTGELASGVYVRDCSFAILEHIDVEPVSTKFIKILDTRFQ